MQWIHLGWILVMEQEVTMETSFLKTIWGD